MTISYNWLSDYLPVKLEPERLSKILTAIGLEVESLYEFNSVPGGLQGLITAEIVSCEKHPDADKLQITTVNTGKETLQVVCGAPNAAAGQKVILARVGTTIYPSTGEPFTIKKAKIRGVESNGMICAEDEIGLGESHAGIMVLPESTAIGQQASSLFEIYHDFIFEIGLTPNRMDAMSHLGVARDVCAYLSHHDKKGSSVKSPYKNAFKPDHQGQQIEVIIENTEACKRFAGISLSNVSVSESPQWLKNRLRSIGLNPINNIVDITNFILHETGQPLHAYDASAITGNKILVKNLPEGTPFFTLDGKERKLTAGDLLVCNAEAPMCIAGVYGGLKSGVTETTTNIFLESAWFDPIVTRKTSFHHGLRTDAAARFEKGVDISNCVTVLKRAAEMIKEICGAEINSEIVDIYPKPVEQTSIGLKYHYLKKLSGKNYHGDSIKNILVSLGFELVKEGADELWVNVPTSKPDISLPADLVEEIMRIDGLDNIEIPASINISPAQDTQSKEYQLREKVSNMLAGNGFFEVFTNSITNSAYFSEATLEHTVKMINNLSSDLDVMRPDLLPTSLEVLSYNINRRNTDLKFFEFGKIYRRIADGDYDEQKHLSLTATGNSQEKSWNEPETKADFYFIKAACEKVCAALGLKVSYEPATDENFDVASVLKVKQKIVGTIGQVSQKRNKRFGIKQPVFAADLHWDTMISLLGSKPFVYEEVSKFPSVQRDLSLVIDKDVTYGRFEKAVTGLNIQHLSSFHVFDIFESEKLGAHKKSMAASFSFEDKQKTLTDTEIDTMMAKLIGAFEKNLGAEIRK